MWLVWGSTRERRRSFFFYYNFEDYFASSIIIIIFGYDVEVVPVRRIGPVQYKTIRLKENY